MTTMRDMHRPGRDHFDLQLDNKQVVSFVIGSVVVLGVVFVLGVLVGKQLAGTGAARARPADSLAALDAREEKRDPASFTGTGELPASVAAAQLQGRPVEPVAARPEPKIAAAGVAELAKPAPAVEVPRPVEKPLTFADELTKPKAVSTLIEPTMPNAPVAKPEEKLAVAPKVEKHEEPKVDPAKRKEGLAAAFERATEPKPAAKGDGFSLQVSSFATRADADKLASKLTGKGFSPFISEAEVPGKGKYFRVKVGAYTSRDEAHSALESFKKKTSLSAIVSAR